MCVIWFAAVCLFRDWLPSSSYPCRGQPPGRPRVSHTDPLWRPGVSHHRHHRGEAHVQQRQLQLAEDHSGGYNQKLLIHPRQKMYRPVCLKCSSVTIPLLCIQLPAAATFHGYVVFTPLHLPALATSYFAYYGCIFKPYDHLNMITCRWSCYWT